MAKQIPSLVLPYPAVTLTSMELIADLNVHTSCDIPTEVLQQKTVMIWAAEAVAFGVPGPLWVWIELSPVPTTTSAAFWTAIGGGGGPSYPPVLPPTAPLVEAATGVNGVIHTLMLPWAVHSPYARVRIQTPVAASLPLAFWSVQVYFMGKS